jgi:hypothetical protein
MKVIYLLSIFFLFSCEKNKIINAKALIPLENPAISAFIDVDKNEISVFLSTITAFEDKYSYANSIIKDAKVYAKKANGEIVNVPYSKNSYLSTISVFSGETIELFIEWRGKKYTATTTIPHKTVFRESKKNDSEIYSLEILNPSKKTTYYWIDKKSTTETQSIGFSLLYPDRYIFPVSDSVTNLTMKVVFFDKNLLKTSPLFLIINLISVDKNLFEYKTISTNNIIDTRGAIKNNPNINNFDNGAVGYFGSLINTEVRIKVN